MNSKFIFTLLVVLLSTALVSCAKKGSTSSTPVSRSTYGATCGNGNLTSQYGCLPQCGTSAVVYQGQCTPINNNNNNNNNSGYNNGYNTGGANMCSGQCGAGGVQVQGSCLPQGPCGSCYGYYSGYCYIGDYAQQAYYGY